ncbi:MAG: hypothetical protein K6F80_04540 [Oscillospiraceae bacterium]|jgi:hypothetical protein|nr:hypothetical protein [Oscillospiraceae bacterium]
MAMFGKLSKLFSSKKETKTETKPQNGIPEELRKEIEKINAELEQIHSQLQAGTGNREELNARARELIQYEKERLEAYFPSEKEN